MKYLPRDVSNFERMIQDGYIYVDKTELIYNLYATGGRYFFLSRPRRFGKSLLISTLKELFVGNKKLFTNLWIGTAGVWVQGECQGYFLASDSYKKIKEIFQDEHISFAKCYCERDHSNTNSH